MTTPLTTPDGTPASRYAFGTMQFGGKADAADSRAMFDACRAAGITHFDTAFVYTGGASETLLAGMIRDDRDSLLIATKAGHDGGAGRANLLSQFDTSRKRLQLDMVDVLYLHRFDPDTDLRETIALFAELKDKGQIRYVGLSNFAAWQVVKAAWIASEFGLSIDLIQPMYNLVKRQAEVEILPMSIDQGILAATYSPLGGGLLTGKYAAGGAGRIAENDQYASRYAPAWMHEAAAGLARLAAEAGTDPATLAVAWVAAHPARVSPIISARNADQLRPSLAAMSFRLDPDLYARIAALSPALPPATDRLEEQA